MPNNKKAVVLSSGGLDSTTVMYMARRAGFKIYSLSIAYGQRHFYELNAAAKVAAAIGVAKHLVMDLDLTKIGGSALTDDISVPKAGFLQSRKKAIPVTYVPARNTIFLSMALAWAEVLGSSDIFIGVNAIDYSGYPDCRPEFIKAFEVMANLAIKAGVEGMSRIKIRTPLINLTKAQIIKKGAALGVDYSLTHSCYDPSQSGLACGRCNSCIIRKKGFKEAGLKDPVRYMAGG
ncbi:MAG: 7-cyano-7-deazaguanine synthase QueC [Candidatus Neomarinimicrobiota bacterium]|nr:MAG: 7-cyano-7-deazaguanine synthase QueC [Candidatus Neomarinimicrobiota bacterium]